MKSVGKIVLTIYVTIATLAAAVFGYLYFNKKVEQGEEISVLNVCQEIVSKN